MSKKKEQEEIELKEIANKEAANSEQAIQAATIAEEKQQQEQNLQQEEQKKANVPGWMEKIVNVTLKFDRAIKNLEEKEKNKFVEAFKAKLENFLENKLIKGFKETENGFSAQLNGGHHIDVDFKNSQINLTDLSEKGFDIASQLAKATGSTVVDVSKLENDNHRFLAWKTAKANDLDVTGLKEGDEQGFTKKLGEMAKMASALSVKTGS